MATKISLFMFFTLLTIVHTKIHHHKRFNTRNIAADQIPESSTSAIATTAVPIKGPPPSATETSIVTTAVQVAVPPHPDFTTTIATTAVSTTGPPHPATATTIVTTADPKSPTYKPQPKSPKLSGSHTDTLVKPAREPPNGIVTPFHGSGEADPCQRYPCKNGATCRSDFDRTASGVFQCACPLHFRGKFCHENMGSCLDAGCRQVKDCVSTPSGSVCICAGDVGGRMCILDAAMPSEWEQVKQVISERSVKGGEIVLGATLGVLVLVITVLCLHCRKVGTRRTELRAKYQEALDRKCLPSAPPPDWLDVSRDMVRRTLCCGSKSSFPDSYMLEHKSVHRQSSRSQRDLQEKEEELQRLLNSKTSLILDKKRSSTSRKGSRASVSLSIHRTPSTELSKEPMSGHSSSNLTRNSLHTSRSKYPPDPRKIRLSAHSLQKMQRPIRRRSQYQSLNLYTSDDTKLSQAPSTAKHTSLNIQRRLSNNDYIYKSGRFDDQQQTINLPFNAPDYSGNPNVKRKSYTQEQHKRKFTIEDIDDALNQVSLENDRITERIFPQEAVTMETDVPPYSVQNFSTNSKQDRLARYQHIYGRTRSIKPPTWRSRSRSPIPKRTSQRYSYSDVYTKPITQPCIQTVKCSHHHRVNERVDDFLFDHNRQMSSQPESTMRKFCSRQSVYQETDSSQVEDPSSSSDEEDSLCIDLRDKKYVYRKHYNRSNNALVDKNEKVTVVKDAENANCPLRNESTCSNQNSASVDGHATDADILPHFMMEFNAENKTDIDEFHEQNQTESTHFKTEGGSEIKLNTINRRTFLRTENEQTVSKINSASLPLRAGSCQCIITDADTVVLSTTQDDNAE